MALTGPRRLRGVVLVTILAAVAAMFASARFYTDVLWFQEVGLSSVLWKSISTQLLTGVAGGAIVAVIVWVNLYIAHRTAPVYAPMRYDARNPNDILNRYRATLLPYGTWLRLGIASVFGLFAGVGASAGWQRLLLWTNRVDFGTRDPQFGRDVGFYVFELPFYDDVLDFVWFALVVALLLSAASHYLYGGIRPQAGLAGVLPAALAHISVLFGLLALVKAAQYWLDQYALNFSSRGVVTGASYTDVHAQLRALQLLAVISIFSSILFLVNIRFRRLALPLAAVGIWILTAVLAGGLWPALVQRFSVEPQEVERERKYIERNIEATRAAFGLDVETRTFPADPELTAEEIDAGGDVLENVRLWDPDVLKRAYSQLQSIKQYYAFEDVDIDRYTIAGRPRQVLLSARELSLDDLSEESRTWSNLRLQFTHGFGLVASLANASTGEGQPEFLVRDVPGTVEEGAEDLRTEQARLYYGEGFGFGDYSVVNSGQAEIDYPLQEGVQRSRYEGDGGIPVGKLLRKVAFAVRYGFEYSLVLSDFIEPDSRIMIYRNVRDRVLRVAPFLALDHDAYPAVVDGRVVWILDAYTSTPFYPYSQRYSTTTTIASSEKGVLDDRINYIRNSVKVVVDAYDGSMTFYVIDPDDPLIRAWRSAFPDLFTSKAPPRELAEHFRYPEDLFKIQSEVFRTYHMTDPDVFYAREDQWEIARSPVPFSDEADDTAQGTQTEQVLGVAQEPAGPDLVEPTYLLITLPEETREEFVLTRPFTPRRRNIMVSLLVGRSDPDVYGQLLTLEFPSGRPIEGPLQVNNLINQNPEISRELSLLDQRGSQVIFGSLVILPIHDSILYIQPLFIQAAEQEQGIPQLKRVVVASGEEIAMSATLAGALELLFGPATEPAPAEPDPDEPGAPRGDVARLVERAAALYDRAQEALAEGDFEEYGRLIDLLGEALRAAEARSR